MRGVFVFCGYEKKWPQIAQKHADYFSENNLRTMLHQCILFCLRNDIMD
jgi:hypothetical protein